MIQLLVNTKAYLDFKEGKYEENELIVESKIFDNNFFGYTKVTVESPITDENGKPILKKENFKQTQRNVILN